MASTLSQRALKMHRAVRTLEERRETLFDEIVVRAVALARANDPHGGKYLVYRVPRTITEVELRGQDLWISGHCWRGGATESEECLLPVAMLDCSREEFDEIVEKKLEQNQQAERARQKKLREERDAEEREEIQTLARLARKYPKTLADLAKNGERD